MSRPLARGALEVVVLADTHLRRGVEGLPEAVRHAVAGSDVIIHAGDVTSAQALAELGELGPVHAVLGNNDLELRGVLPESLALELGGVRVALVHDAGGRSGRPARLRRRFPDADVVVFGHSHVPVDEEGVGGQRLFNPGSPTQRRMQPTPTFGRLRIGRGRLLDHRIEPLEPRARR